MFADENETVDQEQQTDFEQEESQETKAQTSDENETESETEEETQETDEGELVVTFGEDAPPQDQDEGFNGQPAPQWVKDMRRENRELKKQIKAQADVAAHETANVKKTVGAKPTLSDHGYDDEAYEAALDKWYADKREVEQQEQQAKAEQEKEAQQWQEVLNVYNEKKVALKVKDFEEVEHEITEKLNLTQQGIILKGADNPALMVYALGKNSQRLEELAKIKDPITFAFEVAKLQNTMKQTTKRAASEPERKVSGQSGTAAVNSKLARLEAEAEKSGDRTELIKYRKSLNK